MILPRPEDAIHKAWLYRLLTAIADDIVLMQYLRFKGGTCAAMLGRLNRFSIDLDFDLVTEKKEAEVIIRQIKRHLEQCFHHLGLMIKDSSKTGVQYFLKYDAPQRRRNTIKIDALFPPPRHNLYAPEYYIEIDRTIPTQTIETMFANKLVAVLDRWETHQSIAGRDLYDIHSFFLQGFRYSKAVIEERRHTSFHTFFEELIAFIEKRITGTVIQQDLNSLLSVKEFQRVYTTLKQETLMLLRDELQRITEE